MDFGISYPTYIRAWQDVRMAEDYGFTHAWFDDSHMCYSDIFATMALAAEHSRYSRLGTFVLCAGNRATPTVATAMTTLNELAPGRVILGIGSGFSGRNVMGMPPTPLKVLAEEVELLRKLMAGGEARYREGNCEREVRLLHPAMGFVNVEDPIPIYVGANMPGALRVAGEVGDGWITVGSDPGMIRDGLATFRKVAQARGRKPDAVPTAIVTAGCVLRPGEDVMSPRVFKRLGSWGALCLHTIWDPAPERTPIGTFAPPQFRELAQRYFEEYIMKMAIPWEKRYQQIHLGHLIFTKEGEERFITRELLEATTITGPASAVIERIKELEEAGVTCVGLRLTGTDGRELIREFGNEVIARY